MGHPLGREAPHRMQSSSPGLIQLLVGDTYISSDATTSGGGVSQDIHSWNLTLNLNTCLFLNGTGDSGFRNHDLILKKSHTKYHLHDQCRKHLLSQCWIVGMFHFLEEVCLYHSRDSEISVEVGPGIYTSQFILLLMGEILPTTCHIQNFSWNMCRMSPYCWWNPAPPGHV